VDAMFILEHQRKVFFDKVLSFVFGLGHDQKSLDNKNFGVFSPTFYRQKRRNVF
jgi:hypothetical protein